MTWFRVDDRIADHTKVRTLGADKLPAMGLWVLCGSWVMHNLTDGFVPHEIVTRYDRDTRYAARLVEVGLWVEKNVAGEDGYLFHDWEDLNPTRAELDDKRAQVRRRVQKHRAKQRSDQAERSPDGRFTADSGNALLTHDGNAVSNPPQTETQTETQTQTGSVATHLEQVGPDTEGGAGGEPSRKRSGASARGTRLPEDWWPDEKLQKWAVDNAPFLRVNGRLKRETEQFKDWAASAPGQKGVRKDWVATYRTWVRRVNSEEEHRAQRPGRGGVGSPARSTTDDRRDATQALRRGPRSSPQLIIEQPQLGD